MADRKEPVESFVKRLKSRGVEDLLIARTKDKEVLTIPGIVEGTDGDKLLFRYQDKTRTLPLKMVEGVVMAERPEPRPPDELRTRFAMFGGLAISGRWKDLDTSAWKVETDWGQTLNLPAGQIEAVRFRGGAMTYLSDIEPSKVEETPYFGRKLPYRRDVNLLGEPLRINGQTFPHGIAVHSRTVLTYELRGRYAAVRGPGRVRRLRAGQGAGRLPRVHR